MLISSIVYESYNTYYSMPFFLSTEQYKKTEEQFKENNYRIPVSRLKQKYENAPESKLIELSKLIYKRTFEENNYYLQSDVEKLKNKKIIILGHGTNNYPAITNLKDHKLPHHKTMDIIDIVNTLKYKNFPSTIDIELAVCDSAGPSVTSYHFDELDQIIKMAKFNKLFSSSPEKSFAFLFSKTIYQEWHDFNGEIYAYPGEYMFPLQNNAAIKNLNAESAIVLGRTYANVFTTRNEDVDVAIERDSVQVIYNRSDFK